MAAVQNQAWARSIFRPGTTLGRASLFVFVLQFHVYNIAIRPIHTTYTHAWPVILLMTIALLVAAAALWNRLNLNRYLTVGLERLLSPVRLHPRLGTRPVEDGNP